MKFNRDICHWEVQPSHLLCYFPWKLIPCLDFFFLSLIAIWEKGSMYEGMCVSNMLIRCQNLLVWVYGYTVYMYVPYINVHYSGLIQEEDYYQNKDE